VSTQIDTLFCSISELNESIARDLEGLSDTELYEKTFALRELLATLVSIETRADAVAEFKEIIAGLDDQLRALEN
jgi:hypothetical protein